MSCLFHCIAVALIAFTTLPSYADAPDLPIPIVAKIARNGDFIRYGFDSVWMMSGAKLVKVNPTDSSIIDIPIEGSMGKLRGFQIGDDAVWLPDIAADLLFRVDPSTNAVTLSVPVPMDRGAGSIGAGAGSVWVVADGTDKALLLRIDSKSGAEQARISLPGAGAGVLAAFGSVWVTAPRADEMYRIDPSSNTVVQTIKTAPKPRFLAMDDRSVWVLDQGGFVQAIDGQSGEIVATIETGLNEDGGDITFGGGYIWITTRSLPLMQLDPNSKKIVAKFHGTDIGDALSYGAGSVWISGPYIYRLKLP